MPDDKSDTGWYLHWCGEDWLTNVWVLKFA
jgi:hypothetical protein